MHNVELAKKYQVQGRIKGGAAGAIAPGPPLQAGPPVMKFICFK